MHLYGFSLMWMCMWNTSAFLGAVAKLHCVQSFGFSPEWKHIWCPNAHCCFCCVQIVAFIWVFSRPASFSVSILRYEVGKGLTAVQFSPVWAIRWVFRFSARKVSGLSGQAEGSFFSVNFLADRLPCTLILFVQTEGRVFSRPVFLGVYISLTLLKISDARLKSQRPALNLWRSD